MEEDDDGVEKRERNLREIRMEEGRTLAFELVLRAVEEGTSRDHVHPPFRSTPGFLEAPSPIDGRNMVCLD
jgi:hypothetical protein